MPITSNGTVFQYNFSRDNNGGALFECNSLGETANHNVFRFNISQDDGNSNSKGFTLVVRSRSFDQALETDTMASAKLEAPSFLQLLASLSNSDLNRIR